MVNPMKRAQLARYAPAIVLAIVLAGQSPLMFNPGYFSHDELQWAAFAGGSGPIPWVPWTGVDAFQYRPLTFNLWLWLSRHLFAIPQAFHSVLVGWGAINAALLCLFARRMGTPAGPSIAGALVFAFGPFAMFVHGWAGTIADLAWVSCALLLGVFVRDARSLVAATAMAAVLTGTALLAKEAALSIPALLALAWWFDGRRRRWALATLASGAVAVIYLWLRMDALLNAPRDGVQYTPTLAHVPLRWVEYQLYPLIPKTFEMFNTFGTGIGGSVIAATLLWLSAVIAMWRASHRIAWAFLLGGIATLVPVMPLASSANQYGYGFAALTTALAAAAWTWADRRGRIVLAMAAVVSVWHGANVMREMRHVGDVQAVFSPALAATVLASTHAIVVRPPANGEGWIFLRLTHDIPSYAGVPIGDRVRMATDAVADYQIMDDGRLVPLR